MALQEFQIPYIYDICIIGIPSFWSCIFFLVSHFCVLWAIQTIFFVSGLPLNREIKHLSASDPFWMYLLDFLWVLSSPFPKLWLHIFHNLRIFLLCSRFLFIYLLIMAMIFEGWLLECPYLTKIRPLKSLRHLVAHCSFAQRTKKSKILTGTILILP